MNVFACFSRKRGIICSYRYYLNNGLVVGDSELKNFANQLSADGAGRKGGIGKVRYIFRAIVCLIDRLSGCAIKLEIFAYMCTLNSTKQDLKSTTTY